MANRVRIGLCVAAALIWTGSAMAAEEAHHGGAERPAARPAPHPGEAHPGPQGYQRVTEPHGWNTRPTTVDRTAYQHNFQAARSFRSGRITIRPAGDRTAGAMGKSCRAPIGQRRTYWRITGCSRWKYHRQATSGCATATTPCW